MVYVYFQPNSCKRAEELLLKHEDDELVLTIVLLENIHIHWVFTSMVDDTNSDDMMEMNWRGKVLSSYSMSNFEPFNSLAAKSILAGEKLVATYSTPT